MASTVKGPCPYINDLGSYSHHWKLETNIGPISHGKCCLCGEERVDPNYIDYSTKKARGNMHLFNKETAK